MLEAERFPKWWGTFGIPFASNVRVQVAIRMRNTWTVAWQTTIGYPAAQKRRIKTARLAHRRRRRFARLFVGRGMIPLEPRGVAVLIEATHQCMTTRGVHSDGV